MNKFENFIRNQIVPTLPQVLPSWGNQSDNTGEREMSKSEHTPGPWSLHATGLARSGKPEFEIHWSDAGECVAEIVHGEANARLIAAAPELLEALIMCYQSMSSVLPDFNPFDQAAYDKARAAIAKAEGDA